MSEPVKLRLDLPLVLPDVDDANDRCVTRLLDALSGLPGLAEAHVVGRESGSPQLCIHYDPAALSLTRVRELMHSVGGPLTSRFAHLVLRTGPPAQHPGRRSRRLGYGAHRV
ncbi:hypothetical protein [Variovorax sp. RO1]|uniref:hypothetical protein n=1 Tax=Variovorax sp. RO1 TaxID=2066034 RepID=UPI00117EFA5E|nr:hypothetical protein [Variovorax sp. RO1]